MKFSKVYLILVLVVVFFSCKSSTSTSENNADAIVTTDEKPNILIIHVDDLGFHDLSMNGSQIYQTPNIDALAKQSVVFNNAYANYPRCVPSRYAMMTGNYPVQNGNVPDDGFKMTKVPDNKNFVKNIKSAGYQTAYFGKCLSLIVFCLVLSRNSSQPRISKRLKCQLAF